MAPSTTATPPPLDLDAAMHMQLIPKRTPQACDICRKRKRKCGGSPGTDCNPCITAGRICQYSDGTSSANLSPSPPLAHAQPTSAHNMPSAMTAQPSTTPVAQLVISDYAGGGGMNAVPSSVPPMAQPFAPPGHLAAHDTTTDLRYVTRSQPQIYSSSVGQVAHDGRTSAVYSHPVPWNDHHPAHSPGMTGLPGQNVISSQHTYYPQTSAPNATHLPPVGYQDSRYETGLLDGASNHFASDGGLYYVNVSGGAEFNSGSANQARLHVERDVNQYPPTQYATHAGYADRGL